MSGRQGGSRNLQVRKSFCRSAYRLSSIYAIRLSAGKTYFSKLSEHPFNLGRWYGTHGSIFVHEGEPTLTPFRLICTVGEADSTNLITFTVGGILMASSKQVVGNPTPRVEGELKVSGEAKY